MAQILPRDLSSVPGGTVNPSAAIIIDDGSGVWKATPEELATTGAPVNSQGEAEAGLINTGRMTPLRVSQAIAALGVSQDVLESPLGSGMLGTPYGNLNVLLEQIFDPVTSISVGAGGTYATLVEALDWLETQTLDNPVTVSLLEPNTPDNDSGSMAIPSTGYTFKHPNSKNLFIEGPAFGGGQGVITNSALTGVRATDLAYCKSRYGASIRINGTDDSSASPSGGLAFPNGVGGFKRILFEERSRYSLDFGYNRSHLNAMGFSGAMFEDCAFFGSVWGIIGYNAHFSFPGTGNWFGYQTDGGAMGLFRSSVEFVAGVSNRLRFFQPATAPATGAKYIIYADNSYLGLNADGVAAPILAKGAWLHGLFAINGTSGDMRGASFDGVTQPFSIGDAAINITGAVIANADPTNTSLVPGAEQPGVPGNSGSGSLIGIGPGGCVEQNGITISNCVCSRYVFASGGNIYGYGTIAVSGSKATVNAFQFAATKGNNLFASVTTPQGGSVDQSTALQNGDVFWFGRAGLTLNPAANTPTAGSGNYE